MTTEFVDVTDLAAVEARPRRRPRPGSCTPRRSPTRRSSSPTTSPSPTSPTATAPCTSSTTRSPRRISAGRSSSGPTSSSSRRRSTWPATATSWPASSAARRAWSTGSATSRSTPGASLDPHAAFLAMRGLSTLALRMERHSRDRGGARRLARGASPASRRVWHPSPAEPSRSTRSRRRQLARGGGMLAFELDGGRAAGRGRHRHA